MRKLETGIESVNLNEIMVLNESQAKSRYNIGTGNLWVMARDAGAIIKYGRRKGILRERMDDYMRLKAE